MQPPSIFAVIYLMLHIRGIPNVAGVVTVTTSAVTGIPNQQALTLRCSYITDEIIIGFRWRRQTGSNPNDYTAVLSGTVNPQTATFLDTWLNKGIFRGDHSSSLDIELPANYVTSTYGGTYRCEVSGLSTNGQSDVTASVLYAPTISVIPSPNQVIESSRLRIDCSSYTTVGNPSTTSYTWTYKGSTVSSGPVLDINSISRSQSGQYTCTATNTLTPTGGPQQQGTDTAQVNVDVQYAPTISGIPSLNRVIEFSRLRIDCSSYTTVGNPSTTSYSWTHKGSTISSGAVLDINSISRSQSGQYTCAATNTFTPTVGSPQQGTGTAQVNVDVQYLDRPALNLDKTEVTENDTVKLDCQVDSNPTVEMTIKNLDNATVVVEGETNGLAYTIQRSHCLHNGTYACSVENKKTGTVYTITNELTVLCTPRQDYRQQYQQLIPSGINDVASFVASVISNPMATFSWYRYLNEQLIPIPNSTTHAIITSDQQSVLQITSNHNRDYGRYAAVAENQLGKVQLLFTLSPVSPPRSPEEMVVTDETATAVSIRWKSNYNGGSEQMYNIEYKTSESDWWLWKEGISDPGRGLWLNTTVMNLKSDAQYYFQVYSKNLYGVSEKVVRETRTHSSQKSVSETPGALIQGLGIGIGVSLPIIVGLIVALVVSIRRPKFKNKKGSTSSRDNELQVRNLENQDIPSSYANLRRDTQTGNEYEKINVQSESTGSATIYENDPANTRN